MKVKNLRKGHTPAKYVYNVSEIGTTTPLVMEILNEDFIRT